MSYSKTLDFPKNTILTLNKKFQLNSDEELTYLSLFKSNLNDHKM